MRLSTAMMLGSVTIKLEPADWNTCALGAAANAMGLPREFTTMLFGEKVECFDRWDSVSSVWPWLKIPSGGSQEREWRNRRGSIFEFSFEDKPDLGDEIWWRFDNFVCDGTITLEQLVDYVRSIEPDCDCNRFECSCSELAEMAMQGVEVSQ